jgi:hypothetical protein
LVCPGGGSTATPTYFQHVSQVQIGRERGELADMEPFGIFGFMFGLIGFCLGGAAMSQTAALKQEMERLKKEVEKLKKQLSAED